MRRHRVSRTVLNRLTRNKQLEWRKKHVKKQDGCCYYCGKPFRDYPLRMTPTLDHKIPISRGGIDHWENTCAACHSCNQRKGSMTEEEFLEHGLGTRKGNYGEPQEKAPEESAGRMSPMQAAEDERRGA